MKINGYNGDIGNLYRSKNIILKEVFMLSKRKELIKWNEEAYEQYEAVQRNLRLIRTLMKLSTTDLGELVGMTRQSMCNFETGKNKLPKSVYLAIMEIIRNIKWSDSELILLNEMMRA